METFISHIVFTNVDLPLLGLPITDTVALFMKVLYSKCSSLSISQMKHLGYIWNMEEEKKTKSVDPSLSDKLLKTRCVMISGEINKDLSDDFAQRMLVLDSESQDPITVYINSPGGDVDSGFAIYDMIRFVRSEVTVVGMGLVASAAALIYLSVPKERRVAFPNSTYLIHQPLSQLKGTAIEIDIYAKKLGELRIKLDKVIADAVGKSVEDVSKDTERDHWLSAEEAEAYGIVGRIITNKCDL